MPREKVVNGVKIQLDTGDVTDLDIDAFVFYARSDLELGSGYGNAIAMRGGVSIKKELDQIGSLEATKSVVTKAGLMKAEHIIHANGPKFMENGSFDELKKTMSNALNAADEHNFNEVAFPGMGVGYYGIPATDSAKIMFESIVDHVKNGTKLKGIQVLLFDKRQYKPFEQVFDKLVDGKE